MQNHVPSSQRSRSSLDVFESAKRCLVTLGDTLSRVEPTEVSSGSLQQMLSVLEHVASTISYHPAASLFLCMQADVLVNVKQGCVALQKVAAIPEQQSKEERIQLIAGCRTCIARALKQWEERRDVLKN